MQSKMNAANLVLKKLGPLILTTYDLMAVCTMDWLTDSVNIPLITHSYATLSGVSTWSSFDCLYKQFV